MGTPDHRPASRLVSLVSQRMYGTVQAVSTNTSVVTTVFSGWLGPIG